MRKLGLVLAAVNLVASIVFLCVLWKVLGEVHPLAKTLFVSYFLLGVNIGVAKALLGVK